MKVLTVEAAFRLPDGFSGRATDALRMLADHLDSQKISLPGPGPTYYYSSRVWKAFWNKRNRQIAIAACVTDHIDV